MTDDLPRAVHEALIRGNMTEYQSLVARLDQRADAEAQSRIYAGLMMEADEKWTGATDVADIRLWVAEFRNFMEQNHGDLNPLSCEKILIASVIGDPDKMGEVPEDERTSLIGLLAFKLAYDKKMSEGELQDFLTAAQRLAA